MIQNDAKYGNSIILDFAFSFTFDIANILCMQMHTVWAPKNIELLLYSFRFIQVTLFKIWPNTKDSSASSGYLEVWLLDVQNIFFRPHVAREKRTAKMLKSTVCLGSTHISML